MSEHHHFMQAACALARRNLGQTWPNPSVGALIVKEGRIIAQGYTARGGRPHAETQAIAMAGDAAGGATLYVTLEPCSHHGKTPPCSQAIVAAGITRCVIACGDPNPYVNGGGIAQLKQAGIEVIFGICEAQAREINRGFFSVIEKKRPFVSLKLATSLDGQIATKSGESKWITSEPARMHGHLLRSRYDAIVTGTGTVLADDPALTCRIPGLEDRSPVRVVFDSNGRLPAGSQLAKTAKDVPVWLLSSRRRPGFTSLEDAGVKLFYMQENMDPGLRRDDINIAAALELLAGQGITRLLVEAGPTLSTAFLNSGLVDLVYWFRAPIIIGNEGKHAVGFGFPEALSSLARLRPIGQSAFPPDQLDMFELCSPASSAA